MQEWKSHPLLWYWLQKMYNNRKLLAISWLLLVYYGVNMLGMVQQDQLGLHKMHVQLWLLTLDGGMGPIATWSVQIFATLTCPNICNVDMFFWLIWRLTVLLICRLVYGHFYGHLKVLSRCHDVLQGHRTNELYLL